MNCVLREAQRMERGGRTPAVITDVVDFGGASHFALRVPVTNPESTLTIRVRVISSILEFPPSNSAARPGGRSRSPRRDGAPQRADDGAQLTYI